MISTLILDFFESLDGVALLVRQSCAQPARVNLRSAFELFLGLFYMLEEKTEERALSYHVADIHQTIRDLKRLDPDNPEGKAFRATLDETQPSITPKEGLFENMSEAVSYFEQKLDREDEIRRVEAAWKESGKKIPNWYSLFEGPENLKELAGHLKFSFWYEFLYRDWSGTAHGSDSLSRVKVDSKTRQKSIRRMRYAEQLQALTCIGLSMTVRLGKRVTVTRVPEKAAVFDAWRAENSARFARACDATNPIIRIRPGPTALR